MSTQFGAIEIMLPSDGAAALADAATAGFDGFEYYVDGPDSGDDPIWTPAGRTRVRRQMAETGVALPSVCLGYFNYRARLTADDPDARAEGRDAVRRAIDVAAALGSEMIQVPFFGPAEITTDVHEDRVVRGIEAVAGDAAAADVTLALENTLSATENLDLLERIDSPAVAHYYDVGNATALGYDPAAELRELGDRTAAIHVKDRMAEGEDPHRHGTMLDGADVDFEAVAGALDEIGYGGWLILETPSPGDAREDAAENLAFARRTFE